MAPRCLLLFVVVLLGSSSAIAQSPPAPPSSLYVRLGGATKVAAFVSQTVDTVAADSRVSQSPGSAHLADAKLLLTARICSLAGGGCPASSDTLRDDQDVGNIEFRAFVEELRVAMRAQNVPLAARNELLELLAPMYRDVAQL